MSKKGFASVPATRAYSSGLRVLATAHYQLRQYQLAVEFGRRAWDLNHNWPVGLRYIIAGLAQLGRMEEARAALVNLKKFDTNLAFVEGTVKRMYKDQLGIDHILEGFRKAGFE